MTASAIFADGLLDGRHVLVTGGGTGIGLAIARECGRLGARVTLAARRENILAEACAALKGEGIDAAWRGLNIRDNDAVLAAYEGIAAERGLPDFLVNNAGGQFGAKADDISANGFRAVMDLNVQGNWQMSHAFAQRHRAAGTPGRIVNIVFAHTDAMVFFAHAAAARAAVVNLTRTPGAGVERTRHPRQRGGTRPGDHRRGRPVRRGDERQPPDRAHAGGPLGTPRRGRLAGRLPARPGGRLDHRKLLPARRRRPARRPALRTLTSGQAASTAMLAMPQSVASRWVCWPWAPYQ